MVDLTYRTMCAQDFEALHEIVSHWSVVRQLGRWPWPPDPAFTRSRCQPYQGAGFVWAVCAGTRLIGSIGATDGQIGYMYAPDVHGQGIATRVARDAISQAFVDYDWDHLHAPSWHDNPASAAVLRKCGFQHWQSHYEDSFARRVPTLLHQHRLTRRDWDRLRTGAQ